LLGLGSSKPWEDILEEFAGVRTFSAKSCLKYFQPLYDYLQDLHNQGEIQVGWQCNQADHSTRNDSFSLKFLLILSFIWIFYF